MQSPGATVGAYGSRAIAWRGGSAVRAPSGRLARWAAVGRPPRPAGSGEGGMSPGGRMSPMRWGGGPLAVGISGQLPAALMDGAVVGSAQQGEVVQVGGAAMDPVVQVVGIVGQRWWCGGEDAAAVPDGQGGALGGVVTRVVRPSSSGWVGAPARVGGNRVMAAWRWASSPGVGLGSWAAVVVWCRTRVGTAGTTKVVVVVGLEVTAGLAGDQDSGHRPVTSEPWAGLGSSGPVQPASPPPDRMGVAEEAVQVHGHAQLGRTPPVWGSRPPSKLRGGNSPRASGWGWRPLLVSVASAGRANGSRRPADADRPRVPAGHPPPPCLRRSGPTTTPGGHGVALGHHRRCRGRRSGAGGPGVAAAELVQRPGRLDQDRFRLGGEVVGQGVGAGGEDLGMGDRQRPVAHGLGGSGPRSPEQGSGGPDGAGGRPVAQREPVAQPGRGRGDLLSLVGPGGTPGIHGGEVVEPLALQLIH
jgi:hypothetical protein